MAFCIRCIIGAFQTRVFGGLRHRAVNESVVKHHRSRGGRWRSALGDAWEPEPEKTDAESLPDSTVSITVPILGCHCSLTPFTLLASIVRYFLSSSPMSS